jgi:CheY-like chemotaxis protein
MDERATDPERPAAYPRRMRILTVEDDQMLRDFYRDFLTDLGHTVLLAKDGRQAVALAREAPDVIILDLGLPDVHGYEVVRRLHADPATRDVPIVIVTGLPLAGAMDLAGVFGVLRKPYDVPLLERTLERVAEAVRQPPLHL